jgi:hypothetical protein
MVIHDSDNSDGSGYLETGWITTEMVAVSQYQTHKISSLDVDALLKRIFLGDLGQNGKEKSDALCIRM